MSFYLKPPKGCINVDTLEVCVEEILSCYQSLYHEDNLNVKNVQCLIEDTALDRAGHYIFRLAAFQHSIFTNIFIDSEVKLFEKRLSFYQREDKVFFLKSLLRQVQHCSQDWISDRLQSFYSSLQYVCQKSLKKDFSHHVYGLFHLETEYCELYKLRVPFMFVPSMVSARLVELKGGFAIITCQLWTQMLSSLLAAYLTLALKEMKYSKQVENTLQDQRVKECLKLIRRNYFKNVGNGKHNFELAKLSTESQLFPICMQNLLGVLKRNHRLSHDARYELSLFMKNIGLCLNGAIKFWEEEYSKEHSSCSKCTHSWQKNQKKYLYSIRHLYGLEGSRRHYGMKSCNYLQDKILSATDEGGCPFKHFDDDKLQDLMRQNLPGVTEEYEVILHNRRQNPNASCRLFYNLCLKVSHDIEVTEKTIFGTPADYYSSFKDDIS